MELRNDTSDDFFTFLCGEPLMNASEIWDADVPYLGRCVERTILTWIPCLFICLSAPLSLLSLHRSSSSSSSSTLSSSSSSSSLSSLRSRQAPLPWSPLMLSKMVISVVVMSAAVVEMAVVVVMALVVASGGDDGGGDDGGGGGDGLSFLHTPSPATHSTPPPPPPLPSPLFLMDLVAPSVLVVAYGLAVVVVAAGRRYGQRSSGVLFVFWGLTVLCGVPQLVSTVLALLHTAPQHQEDGHPLPPHHHQHHQHQHHPALATTFLLQYLGAVVLVVLNCFAEPPNDPNGRIKVKESPEDVASFPSRYTYHWVTRVLLRGRRRPLTQEDLWPLPKDCRIPAVDASWRAAWLRELSCVRRKTLTRTTTNTTTTNINTKSTIHDVSCGNSGGGDGGERLNSGDGSGSGGTLRVSVVKVALRAYLWHYLFNFSLIFISQMTLFAAPVLLGRLISFTKSTSSEPAWHGYMYAALLMLTTVLVSLVRQCFFHEASKIVLKLRASLMLAVYRKTLTISPGARRESTSGEIVNLMSVDALRLSEFSLHLTSGLVTPITVIVATWQLWDVLGPSVLAGMATMVLIMPINTMVASRTKALQNTKMRLKDKRIKLAGEIINGIKVLKLNAWEEPFGKQVEEVRREEIQVLTKAAYYHSFVAFLWFITPFMVSLASFATYITVSSDNKLDAETAFVAIALFNLLRLPIAEIPGLILQGIQAKVSLTRLEKFFAAQNLDPKAVCSDPSKESAIRVEGGAFRWGGGGGEWALQGVEVEVGRGELVAVVGPVGAGKSSLLSAFLGQMEKTAGEVVVNGQVALVSQEVWLQNASLRENITWGSPWEEARYWRVVKACALMPDLEMLPAGDLTEIGEKGINLSGGQKQRVGLARAAYSGANIMLLDDPLSAVDANVGRHIFECLLGPSGLMGGTTRVLVTHALWVLPEVDRVVVVEDGRLVEQGTCGELVERGGSLARLLLHLARKEVEEVKEEEEEVVDGEMEEEGLEELCAHLKQLPGGRQLLRQISRHSAALEEKDMAGTTASPPYKSTTSTEPVYERQDSTSTTTTRPPHSTTSTKPAYERQDSTTTSPPHTTTNSTSSTTSTKPAYERQDSTTNSTSTKPASEQQIPPPPPSHDIEHEPLYMLLGPTESAKPRLGWHCTPRHASRPPARPSNILEHTKDLWVFRGAGNHGLSPGQPLPLSRLSRCHVNDWAVVGAGVVASSVGVALLVWVSPCPRA
ncbi:multidrug resistance-associated protein 1-like [Eriocheir sinensis]|uniref:multidrug resistance-associated protein 1-like n=1 Tax=Eriocheir sinensis TaxID=95602 RepID=UPI0021C9D81F|nr:multidrug resistance-associated protein 1-like [Eriocheir sinensis]